MLHLKSITINFEKSGFGVSELTKEEIITTLAKDLAGKDFENYIRDENVKVDFKLA